MGRVIVFGSSGHARSVAVILEMLNYEIVGFIDSFLPTGVKILNYKTIGDELVIKNCKRLFGTECIVIGIGDIWGRRKVVGKIKKLNSNIYFPTIISPKAIISNYTAIGAGTIVFNNACINVESDIGRFCTINTGSLVEHNTYIGDFCTISPAVAIGGDVEVNENTFIGSSATVIQKRSIGKNTVIGAGTIVTKDIPDNVLAVGIPATIKKRNYTNKNLFS